MTRHRTCFIIVILLCVLDVAILLTNTVGVPVTSADDRTLELAQRGGRGRSRMGDRTPFDARTLVRAQVTAVDRETGHIVMQADAGRFEADFPASVVADIKVGDIVLVTVNVINTRTATIAGSIASVDHDKDTLTVVTTSGPFTFGLVPDKLSEMKPGDPLVLKLEVLDIGPSAGGPAR